MKSILLKIFIVMAFTVLFILIGNVVYGAELVDFSKATATLSYSDTYAHLFPEVTISGVTLNPENSYYFQYTNGNAKPVPSGGDGYDYGQEWHGVIGNEINDNTYINWYLPLAGDIYVWISEFDEEGPHDFPTPIKVERLPQLPLGKRLTAKYISDNMASITCNEVLPLVDDIKINYKIGRVANEVLLKKIKDNTTDAMEQLLEYAKETEGIQGQGTHISDVGIQLQNLVNGAYYFVYFALDTEQGKYFEIEDVNLYQATVNQYGYILYNQNESDFEWKFDDSNNGNQNNNVNDKENTEDNNKVNNENNGNNSVQIKDNTVAPDEKLPQTGINTRSIMFILAILIVVAIVSYVIWKKYQIV